LDVWQLANELQVKIFSICSNTPLSQDFPLRDQMNRSSGSIADNIAEGFGSGGRIDFIQFLSIARASASELQSQLIRSVGRNYIDQNTFDDLFELSEKTGNKIGAFIKYLNSSDLKDPKFQGSDHNGKKEKRNIVTVNAASPLGSYPHARVAGGLLFLSGIGSRQAHDNSIPGLELDQEGNILRYDIEAECLSVFANVKAVLEAAGSKWEKIIDVTVYLTNMKKDFPLYNNLYAEYFKDVQACRTTVEVKSLPTPIAIELKVIASL
jgi:2-aminomuconate deaminase